jgi:hypothetical protein
MIPLKYLFALEGDKDGILQSIRTPLQTLNMPAILSLMLLVIMMVLSVATLLVVCGLRRKQQSNQQDKGIYESIRLDHIRIRPQALPEVQRQLSTSDRSSGPGYEPYSDHLSPLLASEVYESVHTNTEEVEDSGGYL